MEKQEAEQEEEFLPCDICGQPLEIILTTPRKLGLVFGHVGYDDPIHQGTCHECKLTVPLDY